MRQIIKAKIARVRAENQRTPDRVPDASGLILLDLSLSPVAIDAGAAMILNSAGNHGSEDTNSIPNEILNVIRQRKRNELSSIEIHFQRGEHQYVCRTFLVESAGQPSNLLFVAVHLERKRTGSQDIREFGDRYKLTTREREALGHLSRGLTSSEVAKEMEISPQTVKAFVRGIMAKMGVSSRGEVFAKLLESTSSTPRRPPNSIAKVIRAAARAERF
jgi:DNA-binding CsgD family transcriptional regulator